MAQSNGRVWFSPYAFNLNTGELDRAGMRLRLEIQPAKVLGLLIQAEGNLVPRSELIAALWPGEIEGDFDRRLDKAVAKLRASLNDDPVNPRYIATLKGRGYYFIGEVAQGEPSSVPALILPTVPPPITAEPLEKRPEPAPVGEQPAQPTSGRTILVRLVKIWRPAFVLVTVALAIVSWWFHGRSRPRANTRPVVLILGFRDSSQSSEDAWVSRAVSEWLSTDLNEGGEVQIVQAGDNPTLRTSMTEDGCNKLPPKLIDNARRIFNTDMVVYGDYSSIDDGDSGDRWKLNVCLEGTKGRRDLQSVTVVGTRGDIGQLVSNAGDVLRARLGLKHLSNQSLGYLRASLPLNPSAARLYTEGSSALEHFEPEEAAALLREAAQAEPNHAATHAALSTAWAALGYEGQSKQEALTARDLAKVLSPTQQLEYQGLADESTNDWPAAIGVYTKLLNQHPDSIGYGLKLADAQDHSGKALLALDTLNMLRTHNQAAFNDPRVDIAEAAADALVSNFRGQLAASTQAESHAEAQGAALMIANARMQQANADDMLGNWSNALRLWRLAGQSYESIGNRSGMADALNRQAALAWKKADADNAIKLFEQSLRLSREIGDNAGVAYSLAHMGIVRMAVDRAPGGEMPESVKMFQQAASTYHAIGNAAQEGYVLSLLGDEAMQRTKYEEAHVFYVKAMNLSQAANDRSQVASRLLDLGIVAQVEGHASEAVQLFQHSSAEFDDLGQKDRAAIARTRLGIAFFRSGKVNEAASVLQSSLNTMREFGRENQVREVLGDLTEVDILKDPANAEALTREGLKLDEQLLGRPACAARYAQLADAELAEGKLPDAQAAIREAFLFGEKAVATEPLPNILLARGDVRIAEHDYVGADADFERALRMARTRGNRYLELEARLGLAKAHSAQLGLSARQELDRIKRDGNQLGYGIFVIKIETFLQSGSPAQ